MTTVLHCRWANVATSSSCGGTIVFETQKFCGIHLVPTTEPNEIHGKVQISRTMKRYGYNANTREHAHLRILYDVWQLIKRWNVGYLIYILGLVVELRGLIRFKDRPTNTIEIFGVDKDSTTVLKSTVYQQICGCAEGLQKGTSQSKFRKYLPPSSHIFDFQLKLPTHRSLPPSMATQYADVQYSILVYKRTLNGYDILDHDSYVKPFKFYGYNSISPQTKLPPNIQPFSACKVSGSLQTPRSDYLLNEEIPFTVHIRNDQFVHIKSISVILLRTTIAFYNMETQRLEAFVDANPSKEENEFCVHGVFKKKRDFPSYKDVDADGGGLQIVHTIICEIHTEEESLGGELQIVIGTDNSNDETI